MANQGGNSSPNKAIPPAGKTDQVGKSAIAAVQSRMAQDFSQVVAVLMRDERFKHLRLADLEWLVLPPLLAGQCRLAHTQARQGSSSGSGALLPVAVALWAKVSPAVDKRLSEAPNQDITLTRSEWTSGDILWMLVVAGNPRAIPVFLRELRNKEFKDKTVKIRSADASGNPIVKTLADLGG